MNMNEYWLFTIIYGNHTHNVFYDFFPTKQDLLRISKGENYGILNIKQLTEEQYKKLTDGLIQEQEENEDERIRETLIDYFKTYKKQEECGINTFFGIPTDNVLAWLEKQGERKQQGNNGGISSNSWSEEDEIYFEAIMHVLLACRDAHVSKKIIESYNDDIDWFQSLKKRLQKS